MNITMRVMVRAGGHCELCGAHDALGVYAIPNSGERSVEDASVAVCSTCATYLGQDDQTPNEDHWRCLQTSMWSPHPPVQVLVWRLLMQFNQQNWAQEALEIMFMEDEARDWAETEAITDDIEPTLDANGAVLNAGDSVVIIKDLDVKGTSFVAKRGTPVRNISLTNNPTQIEGRVNGTRIVLLTQYVKKNN
jgi:protein PhnA